MLLEEFDPDKKAVIEPTMTHRPIANFPKIVIATFSKKILDTVVLENHLRQISETKSLNGDNPIYLYKKNIALNLAQIGASACVGHFEEIYARGAEKFIVFGTCGVLDKAIDHSKIIIPITAVRDEGVSYSYLKPSDEVDLPKSELELMEQVFKENGIQYSTGKTWTTDAFYRETKKKLAERKLMGCQFVDMECSAILAWARFRKLQVYPFFLTADNLDSKVWDKRDRKYKQSLPKAMKIALTLAKNIIND